MSVTAAAVLFLATAAPDAAGAAPLAPAMLAAGQRGMASLLSTPKAKPITPTESGDDMDDLIRSMRRRQTMAAKNVPRAGAPVVQVATPIPAGLQQRTGPAVNRTNASPAPAVRKAAS